MQTDEIEPVSKWDRRLILLAKHVASWSKDPSTQVGVVITDKERRILGVGFNGFPRGVKDDPALYADRDKKYPRIVHAEVNAILNCALRPTGGILYLWPGGPPCSACALVVIQSGISRVVCPTWKRPTLADSIRLGGEMLTEAGIPVSYVEVADGEQESRGAC